MKRPSRALRRLGVVGLSAATFAAYAATAAPGASAATGDITGLTISPTSAATSTGGNACQDYTVTQTGSTSGTNSVNVALTATGGVTPEFCDLTGGSSTSTTTPQDFTFTGNTVTFGVNASGTPTAGQVRIDVTPTSPTAGQANVKASATQYFDSGTTQNAVVTDLSATPSPQTATEGQTGVTYTVKATSSLGGASNAVVQGATGITGTVTSKQGLPTGTAVNCGSTTDKHGEVTCTLTAPTSNPLQSGPYTVTFSIATGPTSTVTTTATLNTASQAPAGATIALSCGGSSTQRTSSNACVEPTSATSETFKATVTTPASTQGGTPAPVAGVIVTFSTSAGTVDPTTCTTDSSGTCSTTLTFPANAAQGDTYTVTGTLSNGAHGSATVNLNNTFTGAATNISVAAADSSPKVGTNDLITASVTNQFGNASGSGTDVFFTVTGGTFANGTTSQTVATDLSGKAQISVTSNSAGTATVTATLKPGTSTPNCASPADPTTGAQAGNCTATTDVTFSGTTPPPPTKRTHERPTLHVTKHGHKVHLTAITHPTMTHKTMHFYVVKHGIKHLIKSHGTGANGKARVTVHLKKGRYVLVCRIVRPGKNVVSKFSTRHHVRIK